MVLGLKLRGSSWSKMRGGEERMNDEKTGYLCIVEVELSSGSFGNVLFDLFGGFGYVYIAWVGE